MNDVIHHARPTSIESAAANHRNRFRANIEAQAAELKRPKVLIQHVAPDLVPHDDSVFGPVILPFVEVTCFRGRVTVEKIQSFVAGKYGMTREDMRCGKRVAIYVRARHIALYVARAVTKKSFPELGRRFGYCDHTSPFHAIRKLARLRDKDAALNAELTALIAQCSAA